VSCVCVVVVSCRVVSCRVVSCRVVSCRVVSCRVVSCRVVSSRYLVGGERDDVDGVAGGGPHGAATEHPLELLRAVPQQLGRQTQVCETPVSHVHRGGQESGGVGGEKQKNKNKIDKREIERVPSWLATMAPLAEVPRRLQNWTTDRESEQSGAWRRACQWPH
jgi:hypothetical protein